MAIRLLKLTFKFVIWYELQKLKFGLPRSEEQVIQRRLLNFAKARNELVDIF